MAHILSVLLALSPTIIGGQDGIKHVMEGEEYLINSQVGENMIDAFRIFMIFFRYLETLRLVEVYVLKYLKISSKAVIKVKEIIGVFMTFQVKILRN